MEPTLKITVRTVQFEASQIEAIGLELEMDGYTRSQMAARLRDLAHWIEEGVYTPWITGDLHLSNTEGVWDVEQQANAEGTND